MLFRSLHSHLGSSKTLPPSLSPPLSPSLPPFSPYFSHLYPSAFALINCFIYRHLSLLNLCSNITATQRPVAPVGQNPQGKSIRYLASLLGPPRVRHPPRRSLRGRFRHRLGGANTPFFPPFLVLVLVFLYLGMSCHIEGVSPRGEHCGFCSPFSGLANCSRSSRWDGEGI